MAKFLMSALALLLMGSFASAQESYRIQPGDMLSIEVLEDPSLNRNALVLPDGSISVPLVGSIKAGGQSIGAVQNAIVAGLAPNFATKPNVFVTVSALTAAVPATTGGHSTIDVYVMGEVNNPGQASVTRGTSILQFLAQSGGFTKFAATKRIQVRRVNSKTGQQEIYGFNYKAVESGAAVNSIILREGDVIVVPQRRLFE